MGLISIFVKMILARMYAQPFFLFAWLAAFGEEEEKKTAVAVELLFIKFKKIAILKPLIIKVKIVIFHSSITS